MFVKGNRQNFFEILSNYKKFVWIFHRREDQLMYENVVAEIIPSWYKLPNEDRVHKLLLLQEELPDDITIVESIAANEIDLLLELGIEPDWLWEFEEFKPVRSVILTFDKGWVKNTSMGKCYCINTLVELIVDLYPEKFSDFT